MARTDSLPPQHLVRLVSVPYDALLPWEKDLALGFVRRMADDIVDADLAVMIRNRHAVPDWGPARYADVVLDPAVDEELLAESEVERWREFLARPAALTDPRVRVFCGKRQAAVLEWQIELDRRARLIGRLLGVDAEAVTISGWDQTNGRALWKVADTLYLLHESEERLVMASDYLAANPLLGLEYPEAVSSVTRIPVEELERIKAVAAEDPAEGHSQLVKALEASQVSPDVFAAAILAESEDWVPYLTAHLAADGVEHIHGDVSLVKILAINPDAFDEDGDGPDFLN